MTMRVWVDEGWYFIYKIVNSRAERSHLLNLLMQLRKVAGHPYLFEGVEDRSLDPMGEHVITVEEAAECESRIAGKWYCWTSCWSDWRKKDRAFSCSVRCVGFWTFWRFLRGGSILIGRIIAISEASSTVELMEVQSLWIAKKRSTASMRRTARSLCFFFLRGQAVWESIWQPQTRWFSTTATGIRR